MYVVSNFPTSFSFHQIKNGHSTFYELRVFRIQGKRLYSVAGLYSHYYIHKEVGCKENDLKDDSIYVYTTY